MRDPVLQMLEILGRRVPLAVRSWLQRVEAITGFRFGESPETFLGETLYAFDTGGFVATYTAAARTLGKALVALERHELDELHAAGVGWPIGGFTLDELGRVSLVALVSSRLPPPELELVLGACYRQGDSRERQALLRALPFVTGGEHFVGLAIDACRTNEVPIFEAIACENPYPAAHFPDLSFNQMVLKAMFLGVALGRILGLEQRKTVELARMADDYASERRAAGRSIPADIGLLSIDPEHDRETRITE